MVKLDENASYVFDGMKDQQTVSRSDSDWAFLFDNFCENACVVKEPKKKATAKKNVTNKASGSGSKEQISKKDKEKIK